MICGTPRRVWKLSGSRVTFLRWVCTVGRRRALQLVLIRSRILSLSDGLQKINDQDSEPTNSHAVQKPAPPDFEASFC